MVDVRSLQVFTFTKVVFPSFTDSDYGAKRAVKVHNAVEQ